MFPLFLALLVQVAGSLLTGAILLIFVDMARSLRLLTRE
jgi:hypothetical protein